MEQIPPRGAVMNSSTMGKVARHFHLAFKGMEAEDIYEILTELFIAAVNKYDPNYTAKVKKVVEVIDAKLRKRKRFAIADVNRHLDIDSNRYIRMLCRRGCQQSSENVVF